MPDKPYVVHVISNTHWDREWLMNFQETRSMLVDLMDRLLDILDREPGYRSFVLDSQVAPLDDYLEVRPENRERVVAQVKAGRLLIGPWYTAPEGFSVNGESMVRNLLFGHRMGAAYGGVMKVGHTPFGYGQNSQMPQIYQGFGIDTCLFYHGVSHDEVKNEWVYEGADGTQLLGSQMSSYARYNAYHHLYRGALYGDAIDDRTYAWERGGLPFRLCRDDAGLRHHGLLNVPVGWHGVLLRESLASLRAMEIDVSTTRHLAFMMGHDSSVPDELELKIIEAYREQFPEDEIRHSTYPELMDCIKAEVDWDALTVLRGERRTPKPMPVTLHLYSDVLSSRTRMKQANTAAEYLLQRRAEPFCVWAAQLGGPYPAAMLDVAWKTLLQCHAHDSIAGSGVDDIERDMMYRLRQVANLSTSLVKTALGNIQRRIDHGDAAPRDVLVTVFNASAQARSEVVEAVLDLPGRDALQGFQLIDLSTGEPVPVQMQTRRPHCAIVNHAGDAPANLWTEQFRVHFQAHDVPAMGYKSFKVDHTGAFAGGGLVTAANSMENEALYVRINPDGSLRVAHKETGVVFDGLNHFLDNGEAGHAWMHHDPGQDRVIDSRGFPVSIALEEDGALLARYRIETRMQVPARLEENGGDPWRRLDGLGSAAGRSEEERELAIVSWVTLRRGGRSVEVRTRFDNAAKHHRLRAAFPTRLRGTACHAESQFDVVERETAFPPGSPWYGAKHVTFPQQRFVDVSDGRVGLAILNDGLREYEVTQDNDRTILLTLMRAFEVALCPVSKCWEELPAMELSQAPGRHEFVYRIYPHEGDYAAGGVFTEADAFTVPLEVAQAGPHAGDLAREHSFLSVAPANLAVSAYKRADDGCGYVLRLYNPTEGLIHGGVTFSQPLRSAALNTLEECHESDAEVDGNTVILEVPPKKIITLRIEF